MSWRILAISLLILLQSSAVFANTGKPFVVYDGTLYSDKPDLSTFGLEPISIVYTNTKVFGNENTDTQAWRAAVLGRLKKDVPLVLDVEFWPVNGTDQESDMYSLRRYLEAFNIARAAAPDAKIGFYGLPPVRNYWAPVKSDPVAMENWHVANTNLLPLGKTVDAIYPSLYTFYDNPSDWEKYAKANIQEARRYGKPVYAFLWPEFHTASEAANGRPIPTELWARELAFCRRYTDGVVIWGGFKEKWDPDAPWWKATQAFLMQN